MLPAAAHAADPVVSNLSAGQRAGTKLVDITYDVAADTPTVTVSLEISSDGGVTFSVPATAVSGDIGADIAVGAGKTLTWDAGVDWDQQVSSQTRFRVTADDGVPTGPAGFSLIPAGSFTMGNSVAEDTDITNAPTHTVTVSAFYMGQKEVTKAQWDTVRTWGLANGYSDLPAGSGKATDHPVQTISWYAMVKWCNARSEQEGLTPCYTVSGATYKTGDNAAVVCNWAVNGYRLPTEAEWENAARGGLSGKRFPWGDTISQSQANYRVYSFNGTKNYYSYDVTPRPPATGTSFYHPTYNDGGQPYTSPVGSFAANGYGLDDMAGNVWEWCWDWYDASYYSTSPGTDPRGAASGTFRVCRGGCWYGNANYCRAASRSNSLAPTSTNDGFGFRLARSSVP
jgi:formylglycine-generating enzyme required for sulfatase activity